jgi:hypothetical protein
LLITIECLLQVDALCFCEKKAGRSDARNEKQDISHGRGRGVVKSLDENLRAGHKLVIL